MSASEIIKTQCCGNMLNEPKCDLVKKVEKLEGDLAFCKNQHKNALKEIERLRGLAR